MMMGKQSKLFTKLRNRAYGGIGVKVPCSNPNKSNVTEKLVKSSIIHLYEFNPCNKLERDPGYLKKKVQKQTTELAGPERGSELYRKKQTLHCKYVYHQLHCIKDFGCAIRSHTHEEYDISV